MDAIYLHLNNACVYSNLYLLIMEQNPLYFFMVELQGAEKPIVAIIDTM